MDAHLCKKVGTRWNRLSRSCESPILLSRGEERTGTRNKAKDSTIEVDPTQTPPIFGVLHPNFCGKIKWSKFREDLP